MLRIGYAILAILLAATPALADTLAGQVVAITDGDTLKVLDSAHNTHKVRLAGIDAPERNQPHGQRAKQSLSSLAFGQYASITYSKRDRYGRVVGVVLIQGIDVGLRQVQTGHAWHYKAYQHEQTVSDRAAYDLAETEARTAEAGLWAEAHPEPPWEFRRRRNAASAK